MKVAMIETGGWGGIAHYAWNLCQALAEAGAQATLVTNVRYELDHLPRAFHVEPCFDGGVGYLRTTSAFLRRLSTLSPDITHVQSVISTRFDAFLWPLVRRRTPLVMTAHNVRIHEGGVWETWTAFRSLSAADAIVVHTQESARLLGGRLAPGSQIRLIHHGDYAFFDGGAMDRATARRRLNLPIRGRLLLLFGAIRPYKGIFGAIQALPRILQRHPDARLVIVGPLLVGSEREYRDAIARAGVGDAVTFRPRYVPHDEVAAYFAAADLAVYNYREVTDSGALRIACSLGIPVVASSVGGFREFLTDGVTGRLIPPGSPQALADAINEVLADPLGAARMAQAARVLAASGWSWAESAKATLRLYQDLLVGGRKSSTA